ncbi:MAG: YtxH domain-containing protein [Chloroflexi bacterium]|nr:YtxH domain-containing protein [Chloroflexota bacterium]
MKLRNILIGVVIGLLIAPMPGAEMRRRLGELVQGLLGSPRGPYERPVTDRSSQAASDLKEIAVGAEERPARAPAENVNTPAREPFKSAYPEYVNPELNPNA